MNSFDAGLEVERRGRDIILPFLEERGAVLVLNYQGALGRWMQRELGDLMRVRRGIPETIEIKVERKHTRNLFLETFSNRNTQYRDCWVQRGHSLGWMFTCRASWLFYYFLDKDILYAIDFWELQRWAFGHDDQPGRLFHFTEAKPSCPQPNITVGSLVRVDVLRDQLPRGAFLVTTIQQIQFPGMERMEIPPHRRSPAADSHHARRH